MAETCTCGAELPPDARFCHKCGRPQFAVTAPEPAAEEPQSGPQLTFKPATVVSLSFHNPVAVRTGLSAASVAALLSWLPFVNLGFVIWWVAAGFYAVYRYRRRTGLEFRVRDGIQMGWITGVLTFVIMIVLFTISIVPVAIRSGGLAAVYQEQLRNMPVQDPNMEQALRMLQSPAGLGLLMFFTVLTFFAAISVLCMVGGALGAKVVGRQ